MVKYDSVVLNYSKGQSHALKNYVSESNGQTYVQQYMASRLATWARDLAVRRSIYIGTAPRGAALHASRAAVVTQTSCSIFQRHLLTVSFDVALTRRRHVTASTCCCCCCPCPADGRDAVRACTVPLLAVTPCCQTTQQGLK